MPRLSQETIRNLTEIYATSDSVSKTAALAGVPYHTAYYHTRRQERLHESGFQSYTKYCEFLARRLGFESYGDYLNHLARQKGFTSKSQYNKHLVKQARTNPERHCLSALIRQRLQELEKSKAWLAYQVDVSSWTVRDYLRRKSFPSVDVLKKLFAVLEVPYQTLDDFLHDEKCKN